MGRLAPHPHWVTPMALRAFSHPCCSYQNFLQPCLDTCPYSPGQGCGPGSQGFGVPTLTFCASIVVASRGTLTSFRKTPGMGFCLWPPLFTLSLFLQLSLPCLSVKMCICIVRLGGLSWSVVFRSLGQFFFTLNVSQTCPTPPKRLHSYHLRYHSYHLHLLYLQHHLGRYRETEVILKDWRTDRVK